MMIDNQVEFNCKNYSISEFCYQNNSIMKINPRQIDGNWRAGRILDIHSTSSRPSPVGGYDTNRTEIGELVYQVKYQNDRSKIEPIARVAAKFIQEQFSVDGYLILPYLKVIVPIPPSDTDRVFQPVTEIAQEIGKLLNLPVRTDYLIKIKQTIPQKDLQDEKSKRDNLQGAFVVHTQEYRDCRVMLFDDLYDSGSTLTEATKVLYNEGGVKSVFVLTPTKTRSGKI